MNIGELFNNKTISEIKKLNIYKENKKLRVANSFNI